MTTEPHPTPSPTIRELMTRVMADVRSVSKSSRNTEQNYNFRGIDDVLNAVGPAMRDHGIIAMPELLDVSYRDVTTSRGKPSRECTVRVKYTFYGPAGDELSCVVPGESMDFGDKGTAKAMSVAFRIALLQSFALPTTDTDPDAQSYERAYRDERQGFNDQRPTGPTTEQLAAFDLAAKEIAAAESEDSLRAAWAKIVEANKAGKLHDMHGEPLRAARDDRWREIRASAT